MNLRIAANFSSFLCMSRLSAFWVMLLIVQQVFVPAKAASQAAAKGSITGIVADETGAMIPGASVKAVSIGTGAAREATTNSAGAFSILNVDPGDYSVVASAKGFADSKLSGVKVGIQTAAELSFKLRGQVAEQVEVTAHQEVLQTQDMSVAGLVTELQVAQMPTVRRNFTDLMFLQPGVVGIQGGSSDMVNPAYGASGAGGFANGQRTDTNTFTLDGVSLNDPAFPGNAISTDHPVPMEAIKEFKVQLSSADATEGTSSGAQVNLITKSGSNTLHGSAFYFIRNDIFDAQDPFATKKPPLKLNQYGFSIGGPIRKDKTFFFGAFEGLREHRGEPRGGVVPTDLLYGLIPNDAAHGYLSSVLRTAFGQLPDNPAPGALTGVASFQPVAINSADSFLVRLDHSFTNNDAVFARYFWQKSDDPSYYLFSPSGTSDFFSMKRSQNIVLDYDKVLSPNLTNTARLSYFRPATLFPPYGNRPALDSFGINGDDLVAADSLPFMVFPGTGLSVLGQFPILPFKRFQQIWQVNDDVGWVHGRHTLRFGGQAYWDRLNETISNNLRGIVVFIGFAGPFGLESGDYLSYTKNFPVSPPDFRRDYSNRNYGMYIMDTYRAGKKLTLSFGLRWEYFGVPSEHNGDFHNLYAADSSGMPIPDQRITNFNQVVVAQAGDCSGCLPLYRKDFKLFQPRLGISYQLLDKTVVRAGGSLMDNPPYYEQINPVRFNAPETVSTALSIQPFGTIPTIADATSVQNVYGVDPGFTPSYTMSWNLTIQQEVADNTSITVGYVGTRAVHLTQLRSPNLGQSIGFGTVRPNPNFAVIDFLGNTAFSNYHGLQAEFQRRFTKGLSFQANYTFSKSLDNGSIAHNVFGDDPIVPTDSFDPRLDYGRSDFDSTHVARINYYYTLPFGQKQKWNPSNRIVSAIISNWSNSSILSYVSGHPISILSGFDSNHNGNVNDRAVFLEGTPQQLVIGQGKQYLSPAVTCPPGTPAGSFCTANGVVMTGNYALGAPWGRNAISGPGYFDMDFAIQRQQPLKERLTMTFRTEFYNMLNHPNYNPPDQGPNQLGSNVFGSSLSLRGVPRELQFALRFDF